jgi:hypothetical protein
MDEPMTRDSQLPEAELARLADGSLPPAREAELRALVRSSPEASRALAEQERAISMIRSVNTPAPDSLRLRIEGMTASARPRDRQRPRFRLRLRLALPTTAAVAAAALVIVLLAGGVSSSPSSPSLRQTVRLALASPMYPAPPETNGTASTLADTAAGIPFPYWQRSVGWRALGSRHDQLSGRSITTVFYGSPNGERVGYSIVGGPPVPVIGGVTALRRGVWFTLLREGSARLVTWLRSGHTCVIAGRGVSQRTLLRLATADIPQ